MFKDIYDWAGKPRVINIIKHETIFAGKSVWNSNDDDIERGLNKAFDELNSIEWGSLSKEQFVKELVLRIVAIWQVHPFREGNIRTTVMMLTMFVEHHG